MYLFTIRTHSFIIILCVFFTMEHMQEFVIDSEELDPSTFVKKHQEEFPLKVRVCKGFYGHSERTSVSEGDTFNIHFVKHTKVCDHPKI